jgi:hypothetical protein
VGEMPSIEQVIHEIASTSAVHSRRHGGMLNARNSAESAQASENALIDLVF